MPDLLITLALIAVVLLVAAPVSGLVERAPLSFPIIFLGLGFLLGPQGVHLLAIDAHDQMLETIATLSLALVLFLDAVNLRFDEGRGAWLVPALALGPGTLLVIAAVAIAAVFLLGLGATSALLLGAVLASTDPVVLRDVVRDERVPLAVRRALSVEAGTNDLVVLPIVLVLSAVARNEATDAGGWLLFALRLLLVGPLVGFAVGGLGARLINAVDQRTPIRREYQALYGIGLVLGSYVAGTAVGGDGFLAAFAAGVAVTVFNENLCNCFLEYGETTAEMTMLLAFILFGALLSTLLGTLPLGATVALALAAILLARPAAINVVLLRTRMSWRGRAFIGWFGPRGLSSLLFALLLVRDRVPGAEYLLAVTGFVVCASVVAHGTSATPLSAWYGRRVARQTLPEERESGAAGVFAPLPEGLPRIGVSALAAQLAGSDPPRVLDVRTRSEYARDHARIPGSERVPPERIAVWAAHPPAGPIVTYCTCPHEETSARATRTLRTFGHEASALAGGFAAWRATQPVEPLPEQEPSRTLDS